MKVRFASLKTLMKCNLPDIKHILTMGHLKRQLTKVFRHLVLREQQQFIKKIHIITVISDLFVIKQTKETFRLNQICLYKTIELTHK